MKRIYLLLIYSFIVAAATAQSGNFGIGTSTPGSKLTVNGSVGLAYTSITTNTYTIGANDYYIVWNGTANGTITLPAAMSGTGNYKGRLYDIKNTSATFNVVIDGNGSETIDDVGATGTATVTVGPGDGILLVSNGNTSGTTWEVVSYHAALPTKDYDWLKSGSQVPTSPADSNATIYHPNGLVGIGTNNPVRRLHVRYINQGQLTPVTLIESHNCGSGCAQRPGITLGLFNENVTTTDNGSSIGFMDSRTSDTASAAIYLIGRNPANKTGGLGFYTRGTTTQQDPTEKMRISAAGNVGIATVNPRTRLDVNGVQAFNYSRQSLITIPSVGVYPDTLPSSVVNVVAAAGSGTVRLVGLPSGVDGQVLDLLMYNQGSGTTWQIIHFQGSLPAGVRPIFIPGGVDKAGGLNQYVAARFIYDGVFNGGTWMLVSFEN